MITPAPVRNAASILRSIYLSETARAGVLLFFVLNLCFFPCIWGKKTLLDSSQDAPSILFQGSWAGGPKRPVLLRVLDPGAAAWQNEAWFKLIQHQYFSEGILPLWNANQGYGQPLAANMQSQPFYPLTILLSTHVTPKTYNWFLLLRLFLAGLFMYLYSRWFLSFLPAVAAAILCMLGGYYILFISISHLSVEILLPFGLLAAEYALRKRTLQSVLLLAAMILLALVGGMPESAFLLFAFVYAYWLFRLLSDRTLRPAWKKTVQTIVTSTVVGLSLSMFLLLPFFEYLRNSSNSHGGKFQTGLLYDKFGLSAGTYVLPLLYGLPYSPKISVPETLNRNYIGVLSVFLMLVACAALVRTRDRAPSVLKQLTFFFAGSIVFIVMKRYGVEPVNQIGRLPLFDLIEFRKYAEPILSLSVAMLSAIAIEWLMRREIPRVLNLISFGLTLLLTVTVAYRAWPLVGNAVLHSRHFSEPRWAFLLGALLLCAAASCIAFSSREQRYNAAKVARSSRRIGSYLVALVAVQACFVYIIPAYYIYSAPPDRSNNPYIGAPFVNFLKSKTANQDRIVGRDGVLVSNWASVFGLYDIRDHDAMYVRGYFSFLDNFFRDYRSMGPELESTYRGIGSYDFANPLERRLLQISSARYIATQRPFTTPDPRIEEILLQNRGRLLPGKQSNIGKNDFALDGDPRSGLGEHPPYARLPYRLKIDSNRSALFHFSCGLNPQVYAMAGDGVGFTLEIKDQTGKISPLFSRYIDPKHNLEERHWISGSVDLSRYRGQWVELLFSTDPGPKGDTTYDWAAWSGLHFEGDPAPLNQSPFKQIYEGAARVFEYDDILPRAALFYHADVVKNDSTVLERLADPSLDVFRSVVLDASTLDGHELKQVNDLNRHSPQPVGAAKIVAYGSQSVGIEATLDRPGVLMLNDTRYPGWEVDVDRRPSRWFAADYLFRGVFLGPGKHLVQFTYRPASFRYGATISAVAAVLMIIVGMRRRIFEWGRNNLIAGPGSRPR